MKLRFPALAAATLALVGSLSTTPAQAQLPAAQALFDDAKRLLREGQVNAACEKFAESLRLEQRNGTLINLAACHRDAGKTASAWAEFRQALSMSERDGREDRVTEARAQIALLEKKLSMITFVPPPQSQGMTIRIDDVTIGRAAWGTRMPFDPGAHVLEVTSPPARPRTITFEVLPGPSDMRLTAPAAAVEADVDAPPVRPPAPPPRGSHTAMRTTSYVLGGVGLVSLTVGGAFGVVALAKHADTGDQCRGGVCTPEGAALNDSANRAAWVSNVGIGLGLVSLGVATVLFFVSRE
jgi:hypothetical protein